MFLWGHKPRSYRGDNHSAWCVAQVGEHLPTVAISTLLSSRHVAKQQANEDDNHLHRRGAVRLVRRGKTRDPEGKKFGARLLFWHPLKISHLFIHSTDGG